MRRPWRSRGSPRCLKPPTGGFVGASALIIGAGVAFAFRLSRMAIGLIMAFGRSALFTGLATTAGFVLAVFLTTLE